MVAGSNPAGDIFQVSKPKIFKINFEHRNVNPYKFEVFVTNDNPTLYSMCVHTSCVHALHVFESVILPRAVWVACVLCNETIQKVSPAGFEPGLRSSTGRAAVLV